MYICTFIFSIYFFHEFLWYINHIYLNLLFCSLYIGSTYLGQVGTLVGWTASKSENNIDARTCRPRKLGLPILGYKECIKSGMNLNFNDDYGCIGVVGTSSLVCEVNFIFY